MSDLAVKALGLDEFRQKLSEVDANLWSAGARRLGEAFPPRVYDARDRVLYILKYEDRS